jgi:hypothetical protein
MTFLRLNFMNHNEKFEGDLLWQLIILTSQVRKEETIVQK